MELHVKEGILHANAIYQYKKNQKSNWINLENKPENIRRKISHNEQNPQNFFLILSLRIKIRTLAKAAKHYEEMNVSLLYKENPWVLQ